MARRRHVAERVRIKALMPPGHIRAPWYLRGKTGWVERTLGPFPNPEDLAYRHPGQPLALMRVRFTMAEVWGADVAAPDDTIDAEIYSHWLEPAEAPHAP